MRKKKSKIRSIISVFMALLAIVFLLGFMRQCHRDPEPTPGEETVQIIIDEEEIVF